MKKYFLHLMMALILGATMSLTACNEPGTEDEKPLPVEPNFPAEVTKTLAAGESYTFEMTPNCDWSLSLPVEQMGWFWIQDGDHKVSTVHGAANEQAKIVVTTSEQEEFDNAPVCELSLTMNGETRVVATITRGTIEREFAIYACVIEEDTFSYATEGELNYAYGTTPVSEIELIWPEGLNGYSFPMLFEANFKWHVVVSTLPEWLTLSTSEGEAGEQVEVRLSGSNELEARTAQVLFCDADNAEATFPLTVKLPDCIDHFAISGFPAESRFNAAGEFGRESSDGSTTWLPAETGAEGYVTDIKDTKLYLFTLENGSYTADASMTHWISASLSEWQEEAGHLQTRTLTITVQPNEGAEREGLLYAVPATKAPAKATDLLDAAYDAYRVTKIRQSEAPVDTGALSVVYPEDMEGYATFVEMNEENNNNFELVNGIGPYGEQLFFDEGYILHYASAYAADYSDLKSDRAYTTRFFDAEYNEMTDSESWLSVMNRGEAGENQFCVVMTPGLDKVDISNWGVTGVDHLGYVGLFDEEGHPFALIRCEYAEEKSDDEGFSIEFVMPSFVQNATLTKVSNANLSTLIARYPSMEDTFTEGVATGYTMYVLEYISATPTMAILSFSEYYMYNAFDWVTLDDSEGQSSVVIDMSGRSAKGDIARIEFYNKSFDTICFLYCVANF